MVLATTMELVICEKGIPVFIDAEYDSLDMKLETLEKVKVFGTYPDVRIVIIAHVYTEHLLR